MPNDPTTIAVRRHRALMIVRMVALALGVFGAIALCYQIGMMIVMQDVMGWTVIWGDTSWFSRALAFLIPATALSVFDRRIVRWMIPVPRRECHECGYPLRGLSPAITRCPECGTAVCVTPGDAAASKRS